MKEKIITDIRQILMDSVNEKTLTSSKRFFKEGEEALVYGVRMGEVNKIGTEFYNQINGLPKQEIFEVCEELWKSRYLEEAIIACIFSESLHKKYEPSDFNVFEHWIKEYVNNWGECDILNSTSNH